MHVITTEKQIGNTLFVVTSECSGNATETVDQKLGRLICRHVSDIRSYQSIIENPLAMCGIVREHASDIIMKEKA